LKNGPGSSDFELGLNREDPGQAEILIPPITVMLKLMAVASDTALP
jgi:hypothetical protein